MNNASRGYCLFEAYADQGLLVAKQPYTTLRLGQSVGNGQGENVLFHGILSRHDHSFRPSIGSVRTKAAAR